MTGSQIIILSIIVFSYVIIAIMLYVGISSIKDRVDKRKLMDIEKGFGDLIKAQINDLNQGVELNKNYINVVEKSLECPMHFKVFCAICADNHGNNPEVISKYVNIFEDRIVKLFLKMDSKNIMKYAYYVFLIGEFRINKVIINKTMLENLNSDSVYIRVNSLKALSKIGDMNSFIDALRIISLRGRYFNEKVIIDAIDSFEGDSEELDRRLVSEMSNFTDDMINMVITHFSNRGYRGCESALINKISDGRTSKEVTIRLIRYFDVVYTKGSERYLYDLIESPYWEVRAAAAKTLSKYNFEPIKYKLKSLTGDFNYHVRYNAAMTLIKNGKNDSAVQEIINGEDKYARDIMIYSMFHNNLINYEEYKAFTKDGIGDINGPVYEPLKKKEAQV
ncbi:MAG: HEAT repeat domain-containing protein [Clostridium sp.]|uniref:HEAT repeat domain-containing protein n=1 Tax=Clostridium sp. TaxID=1506 RepID=UPI002FC69379